MPGPTLDPPTKSGFGKFLSGLGSGLMGGLPGFIFSGLSSIFSNRGAKRRQQQADRKHIEFWNMQNRYNTPTKQMERLKAAGLNPNLIYGSGSANTGVAGSIAPSKAAPYNVKDPTPSVMQSALFKSQIDLNEANARNKDADTFNIIEGKPGITAQSKKQEELLLQEALNTEIKSDTKKAQITKILQQAKQEKIKTTLANAQKNLKVKLLKANPPSDLEGGYFKSKYKS
jgi:hypothetical protein